MKRDYPHLCEPLAIGNLTLRNRMCSAPLGATDITAEGSPGPRTQGFYELRAKGGAAVVTVSELVVHPETDGSQMLHLNLKNRGQLAAFAFVADAIKRHGSVPSIELSHSGQYAGTYMVDKKGKRSLFQYGPSETTRPDGLPVKKLTQEQIQEIVAAYAQAAALSKQAGFEMVMVHAGHSWLINQFLSPHFNKRADEYGGSFENRIRLAQEVLAAVRDAVGAHFPLELRMSGSELFDGGYDLEEGCRIAVALEEYVDIIQVSAGSYQYGFSLTHPSIFREPGCNVYLAEAIKKQVSVPVATVGALSNPSQMEDIISSGKADLVVMGRALLADPEIPNKVMANRGADVIECVRCYVCMAERAITQTRRCALNPRIGREYEGMEIIPAAKSKRVLVAGGGIAGMMAAATAAERGHDVILCERASELGGILRTEKAIPFKQGVYKLGLSYARACEQAGVTIKLNTPVTAELVEELAPDAAIIALGSEPIALSLERTGKVSMLSIDELYLEHKTVGQRVVVLGGGVTGSECALYLCGLKKQVTIVEMRDGLAIDANVRQKPILLKEVEDHAIEVVLEKRGYKIQDEGLVVVDAEGNTELLVCDTIICAVGQKSRKAEVDALRDSAPFVRIIGDAKRPATIGTAIYEAFHAALDI